MGDLLPKDSLNQPKKLSDKAQKARSDALWADSYNSDPNRDQEAADNAKRQRNLRNQRVLDELTMDPSAFAHKWPLP